MASKLCSFDTPDIKEVEEPISERLKKKFLPFLLNCYKHLGKHFLSGIKRALKIKVDGKGTSTNAI